MSGIMPCSLPDAHSVCKMQARRSDAEITEQVPNARIVWRSVNGASNRGAVTFKELDVSQTRVTLTMDFEPEGFLEHAGDELGISLGEVAENLNRFREFNAINARRELALNTT
jgi:uncharacterized membrane protein